MSHTATTVQQPARETTRKSSAWKRGLFGLLLLAAVAVAFLGGYWPRRERQAVLASEAKSEAQAIPVVNVAKVVRSPAKAELLLPGTTQALAEAPVMPRASGYVKRRLADIGDVVSEGQVLAEIEAPELDQQIRQAVSAKEQAAAGIEQSKPGYVWLRAIRISPVSPPNGGALWRPAAPYRGRKTTTTKPCSKPRVQTLKRRRRPSRQRKAISAPQKPVWRG